MASILRTHLEDEWVDPDTVTLEERPFTAPLPVAAASPDHSAHLARRWEQRVNAECDRTPTVDLGVKSAAASFEQSPASPASEAESVVPEKVNAAPQPSEAMLPTTAAAKPSTSTKLLRGRYQLDKAIAAGGSALIYRARDLHRSEPTGALIAVKLLKPECRANAAAVERLKREYAYTLKLPHPNIVRVFDLDYCEQHGWFMTMELLEGDSLATLMRRTGTPIPRQQRLAILIACGRALSFAHQHGVLHCDLKPSNVMVTTAGRVCVLDFGAACTTSDAKDASYKAVATTPAYASPPLLAGKGADTRDDLFSLARIAYELFGEYPPLGLANAHAARKHDQVLTRPAQITHRQWQALQRALSPRREPRQPSVAVFITEFTANIPQPAVWWLGAAASVLVISGLTLALTHTSLTQFYLGRPTTKTPAESPQSQVTTAASALETRPANNIGAALVPTLSETLRVPLNPAASKLQPQQRVQTERSKTRPARPPAATAVSAVSNTRAAVSFEQSHITVSDLAVAAVITITRSAADDDQRIQWRTIDGTAHAGVDYDPTVATAVFRKLQTRRAIYVNLKKNAAAHGDRTFTVEVRRSAKDAVRAEVTIRHAMTP